MGLDTRDAPAVSGKESVAEETDGWDVLSHRRRFDGGYHGCRHHPTLEGTGINRTGNVKLGSEGNDAILLTDHGVKKGMGR